MNRIPYYILLFSLGAATTTSTVKRRCAVARSVFVCVCFCCRVRVRVTC